MANTVDFKMIQEARERIKDVARCTPIITAKKISENIFFKAENLQKTGSFKIRGAYNKICMLNEDEMKNGVIACSAGNHAQGVAISATSRGVKSIICMPENAPLMKQEATKCYGAEVITVKGIYDDAAREAERLSKENGYAFIHPFDDPYVIAGQGTIGCEIIEQVPDVEQVIVPIGGGGLVSGVALAIKTLKPDCKVIGVEAASVASMYGSVKENHITTVPDAATVADGIHVLTPGKLTFDMTQKYVDEVITVEEDEIYAAIIRLLEGPKIVSEGAGATTLAAFLYGKVDTSLKTVCVISGGNIDMGTFDRVFAKGSVKLGRSAVLSIEMRDDAKALADVMFLLDKLGVKGIHINDDPYIISGEVNNHLTTIAMETRDNDHIKIIKETLAENGYRIIE